MCARKKTKVLHKKCNTTKRFPTVKGFHDDDFGKRVNDKKIMFTNRTRVFFCLGIFLQRKKGFVALLKR